MPRSTGTKRGVAAVRWEVGGLLTTGTTPSIGWYRTPMEQYLMVTEEEEEVNTNHPRAETVGCRLPQ